MTGQSLGATLKQITSISFESLGRTILNYKTPAVILKCAYGIRPGWDHPQQGGTTYGCDIQSGGTDYSATDGPGGPLFGGDHPQRDRPPIATPPGLPPLPPSLQLPSLPPTPPMYPSI